MKKEIWFLGFILLILEAQVSKPGIAQLVAPAAQSQPVQAAAPAMPQPMPPPNLPPSVLISNQIALFGTNQIATNAFAGTNGQTLSNQTISVTEDEAISVADQRLLFQVRALLQPVLGLAKPFTPVFPVHLIVQDSVVTVLGQISNEAQRQQILTIVQRTPGVMRVVDQLTMNAPDGNPPGYDGSYGLPLLLSNGVPTVNRY